MHLFFNFDPSTTSAIFLGLIVAASSTISPLILSYLTARGRHNERLEDFARQDAVAAQAAEAARLLSNRQDAAASKAADAAKLLVVNTAKVAETAKITNIKLDVIHTLVNSNMTAAMQAELDATTRELAMMGEVIELKRVAGREPNVQALAAIEATKSRISELTAALADRLKQSKEIAETTALLNLQREERERLSGG